MGRFLWLTALGTLIPGTGLIAAGRRSGKAILALVILGLLGVGFFLMQTSFSQLTEAATSESKLALITFGLLLVAAGWMAVAIASQRALEPRGLSDGKRLAGSVVVIATASIVIAPIAYAAQTAWTARDLIGNLAQGAGDTATQVDMDDPWADLPRVNVLLMGGDGGVGRDGIRPDTLILTSIDTTTGDTIMFSLPRNLANVPFPEGSTMSKHYPSGFQGSDGFDANNFINAVYHLTPDTVLADAFPTSGNPRADATKQAVEGALGVDVDFYVLANLAGFEQIVDAMGGVTIDVPYPIPVGTKVNDNHQCVWTNSAQEWIAPGQAQQLDGHHALWFTRARCSPFDQQWPDQTGTKNSPIKDNYNRMERQRCMMGAIAANANPMNLLANFQSLAQATEDALATDIPPGLWSAFAELGLKVKDSGITSVIFDKEVMAAGGAGTPDAPIWAGMHAIVQESLSTTVNISDVVETSTDATLGDTESTAEPTQPVAEETEESEPDGEEPDSEPASEETESATPQPDPTDPTDVTATC